MAVIYDLHQSVEAVYKALTDPQFLVDRHLALGELSAECTVEDGEDSTTLNLVREATRELPRVLAKIIDPVQIMEKTETWQAEGDGWRGNWVMTVRGWQVTGSAMFSLTPCQDGCRYSVTHQAKASVPVVGKQLEKYILGQIAQSASDELQYLADHLSS